MGWLKAGQQLLLVDIVQLMPLDRESFVTGSQRQEAAVITEDSWRH